MFMIVPMNTYLWHFVQAYDFIFYDNPTTLQVLLLLLLFDVRISFLVCTLLGSRTRSEPTEPADSCSKPLLSAQPFSFEGVSIALEHSLHKLGLLGYCSFRCQAGVVWCATGAHLYNIVILVIEKMQS